MQKFVTLYSKHLIYFGILVAAVLFAATFKKTTPTSTSPADTTPLPIIMYHSVLKDTSRSGKYVITPDMFENDLKFFQAQGYTAVFMSDVIDFVKHNTPLPPKPIVLTFDDGFLNNKTYVVPLLEKYNQKAVISVVGEYTAQYSENPDENPNYAYLSRKNIREIIESGRVEIQNHSYSMHKLAARRGTHKMAGESVESYRSAFMNDVEKMQNECEKEFGLRPSCFTYPFGSISPESEDFVKELGFSASLSCTEGINYLTAGEECLFLMKRCIRTDKRSAEDILL